MRLFVKIKTNQYLPLISFHILLHLFIFLSIIFAVNLKYIYAKIKFETIIIIGKNIEIIFPIYCVA